MMVFSFPIGVFIVFNSDIGQEINFEYPLNGLEFFNDYFGYEIPFDIELGDAFIVIWAIFVILFSISILGPKKDFLKTLFLTMAEGKSVLFVSEKTAALDVVKDRLDENGLGSLANRRRIRASSGLEHSELCQVGATGGVLMCWPMMATESSPKKGGRPVTIS